MYNPSLRFDFTIAVLGFKSRVNPILISQHPVSRLVFVSFIIINPVPAFGVVSLFQKNFDSSVGFWFTERMAICLFNQSLAHFVI